MKYDHLTIENLPFRLLYSSPGCTPDSKYSDLIGTLSEFNCIYLGGDFLDRAEICR